MNTCLTQNMSFFLQPAKEEKLEESVQTTPEEKKETTKEADVAEEEKKGQEQETQAEADVQEGDGQTSIFQSPFRLVRKPKMKVVVCHVTLLDGTDFSCEVEVRLQKEVFWS